ncbi:uncharacterized mitochondrial protein-like protein [Tanacetum coccineum]
MLVDSKLPTTFWTEAVSTACYVQNMVLVVKPRNKTSYELFRGFKLALSFMRPFGCHVTILNTLDNLGKFDGKSDEGLFVGYSLSTKAFRLYNTRTRKVEEKEKKKDAKSSKQVEEEIVHVIPLAVKSPIVNWKSYCKGDVGYYEIHRADGSYKTYIYFSEMLNDFDREYLIVLYRLFNENQELIEWKLYDSCEVHSLMLGEVSIHMLVEKKYPLLQNTLTTLLQWKLHVNYNVTEMAYELLRFIKSQLHQ